MPLSYPVLSNPALPASVQVIAPVWVDEDWVTRLLSEAAGGVTTLYGSGMWAGVTEDVIIFTAYYAPSTNFTRVCNALTDICQNLFSGGEKTVAVVFNGQLHLITPVDLPLCRAAGCRLFGATPTPTDS